MDSKFSFLDQAGLFNGAGNEPETPQEAMMLKRGSIQPQSKQYGASSQQPAPQPSLIPPSPEAFLGTMLENIMKALAYTEKRIAVSEANILKMIEAQKKTPPSAINGWIIAIMIVAIILLIATTVGWCRRSSRPDMFIGQPSSLQGGAVMPSSAVMFPVPPATFMQ